MSGKRTVLEKTTDAATSDDFQIDTKGQVITIQCIGLIDDEEAYLQQQDMIDDSWVDIVMNGVTPTFNAGNSVITVDALLNYRVRKLESTAEVGVAISTITVQ